MTSFDVVEFVDIVVDGQAVHSATRYVMPGYRYAYPNE
jgi:hypothetical protein